LKLNPSFFFETWSDLRKLLIKAFKNLGRFVNIFPKRKLLFGAEKK